tara:strand:+ start:75 stop:368 length:294 start_codon:yes stop_codon:yes gene_type:complete
MHGNVEVNMSLEEELEGKVFELYKKTPSREFKSHCQFIKADSLTAAEDEALVIDPEYWKTKSVRPVTPEYVWDTFIELHYAYSIAKGILELDDVAPD